jgi:hypothetical protein
VVVVGGRAYDGALGLSVELPVLDGGVNVQSDHRR